MSNRYDDRDYDRGERSGRRRDSEYGRSSERTQERYRWGREDDDDDRENRYAGESSRWGGQYGRSRSGGEYGGGREGGGYRGGQESHGRSEYDRGWEGSGGERDRSRSGAYTGGGYMGGGSIGSGYTGGGYGYTGGGSTSGQMGGGSYGSTGGGYGSSSGGYQSGGGSQQRFGESSNRYSQRYDYPSDYPSRSMHSNQGERPFDYDRSRFGRGQESGYEYDRDRYGQQGGQQGGEDRGWWDRASDAVASWFGDEEADRRRRMDQRREEWRGKGPKGYRRSDERIREDINDRLSEGYLDASDVEVSVSNAEVTLTGTVNNRWDKRRAEDIAEAVNGVTHVENRIRVKQHGSQEHGSSMSAGSTSTYGAGSDTSTASMGAGGTGTSGTGSSAGKTGTETTTGTTGGATSSSSAAAGGTGTRAKS